MVHDNHCAQMQNDVLEFWAATCFAAISKAAAGYHPADFGCLAATMFGKGPGNDTVADFQGC